MIGSSAEPIASLTGVRTSSADGDGTAVTVEDAAGAVDVGEDGCAVAATGAVVCVGVAAGVATGFVQPAVVTIAIKQARKETVRRAWRCLVPLVNRCITPHLPGYWRTLHVGKYVTYADTSTIKVA